MTNERVAKRISRHARVRKKIAGTGSQPRLCVRRSLANFYCQIIDDDKAATLLSLSTLSRDFRPAIKYGGNIKAAAALGEAVAKRAKEMGISRVSFDRGGYLYHGRIKAFAEAARKAGLEF
ncbi:MAG: 50S ribosomal protein L18 [Candidatus Omnitrophota bacterium]